MASQSTADTRECDPSLQFDVDALILDYLAYNALKSVLQHAESRFKESVTHSEDQHTEELPFDVNNGLQMAKSFLDIFNDSHASTELEASLRFRLQLLRFATLFVLRSSTTKIMASKTAIDALRGVNRIRSRNWLTNGGSGTIPSDLLSWYEDLVDTEDQATNGSVNTHNTSLLALLDILPSFVELVATRSNDGEWQTSDACLELAGEMMLQSVLEECASSNQLKYETFLEAFAWGFEGMKSATDEVDDAQIQPQLANQTDRPTDDMEVDDFAMDLDGLINMAVSNAPDESINTIFCHLEDALPEANSSFMLAEANAAWTRIRSDYLKKLLPGLDTGSTAADNPVSSSPTPQKREATLAHLHNLAAEHPLTTFNVALLAFLNAMSESVAKPVLLQLELAADEKDEHTPLEIDVDFQRMIIDGDEEAELRELATKLKR